MRAVEPSYQLRLNPKGGFMENLTNEEKDRLLFSMKNLLIFLSGYVDEVSRVSFKYSDLPVIQTTHTQRQINKLSKLEFSKIIDIDFILEKIESIPSELP